MLQLAQVSIVWSLCRLGTMYVGGEAQFSIACSVCGRRCATKAFLSALDSAAIVSQSSVGKWSKQFYHIECRTCKIGQDLWAPDDQRATVVGRCAQAYHVAWPLQGRARPVP